MSAPQTRSVWEALELAVAARREGGSELVSGERSALSGNNQSWLLAGPEAARLEYASSGGSFPSERAHRLLRQLASLV